MEYHEFASIAYHKTDAHVKWTDTEIEIGGALSCQQILAFLLAVVQKGGSCFRFGLFHCKFLWVMERGRGEGERGNRGEKW